MARQIVNEISIAIVLVLLILGFLDPFHYWMPGTFTMMLLFIALIVFMIFAVFVWREQVQDEREEYHRMQAGRLAWLAGAAILLLGIIVQELNHMLDVWLVYALLAMILAKLISLVYVKYKN